MGNVYDNMYTQKLYESPLSCLNILWIHHLQKKKTKKTFFTKKKRNAKTLGLIHQRILLIKH